MAADAAAGGVPPPPATALPDSLRAFCARHGIDARMYSHVAADVFPRFIRVAAARRGALTAAVIEMGGGGGGEGGAAATGAVGAVSVTTPATGGGAGVTPGGVTDAELAALRAAYGASVARVTWLDPRAAVCVLDGATPLASSPLYAAGVVHGIDVSSAASVIALDPQPGDRVLDMCCAPGAKLCLIAELMATRGALVGVDYSPARLSTTASLLRKYDLVTCGTLQPGWRLQLYGCDGRRFNAAPPAVPRYSEAAALVARLPAGASVAHAIVSARLAARLGGGSGGAAAAAAAACVSDSGSWVDGCDSPIACSGASSCGASDTRPSTCDGSDDCRDGDDDGGGGGGDGSGSEGRRRRGGVAAAGAGTTPRACVAAEPVRVSPAASVHRGARAPPRAAGRLSVDAPLFDSMHENLFRRSRDATAKGLRPVTQPRLQQACSDVLDADAAAAGGVAPPPAAYDRVLVDAECSHDGSIKHVAKQLAGGRGVQSLHDHIAADAKGAALQELQRGLLANGFRLLRPGGTLVYSTCSLTRAQNEDIVAWLLATDPRAALVPVPHFGVVDAAAAVAPHAAAAAPPTLDDGGALRAAFLAQHTSGSVPPSVPGGLHGTVRFEPLLSGCSGLFIARLTKRAV